MSELCKTGCEHGGLCTLPKDHPGDHKALYRQAEPDGGAWCTWPRAEDAEVSS